MIGIITSLPKEYAAIEVMLDACADYVSPGQELGGVTAWGRRQQREAAPIASRLR